MTAATSPPPGERLYPEYWSANDATSATLWAFRCTGCGTLYLPRGTVCTGCGGTQFERVPLSSRGAIYSVTTIHGAGGVWPETYSVAYVDFPEGVRVFGHVRPPPGEPLAIGSAVEAEPAVLYTRKDGAAVSCFRFRAAGAAGAAGTA